MNNNTNTNRVNAPQGTRRPVTNNQTGAEQNHNAQINNLNNVEVDTMENTNLNNNGVLYVTEEPEETTQEMGLNAYTNKISSSEEIVIKALVAEVFTKVYANEESYLVVQETIQEKEEVKTIFSIYFNALDEQINKTLLFALLKERNMMPQGYGQLQFFINTEEGFKQVLNKDNKPVIHFEENFRYNKNYFSQVISFEDQSQFNNFYKRFLAPKNISAQSVLAYEINTLNSNKQYQVLVLDLDASTKALLYKELGTSKKVKSFAKKAQVVGTQVSAGIKTIRTDLAPVVAETVVNVATEGAFLVMDTVDVAAKTVYKQVGSYALEKSENLKSDISLQQATNNYKQAFCNFKNFLTKDNSDENSGVYYC